MRIPLIAGNWKMNATSAEAEALVKDLKARIKSLKGVDVAVCPPFPYLALVSKLLEGTSIALGAQNMFWEKEGAFTGEVSGRMLRDVGCRTVVLGHSERRQHMGETDAMVARKIRQALEVGLFPIVCVGETLPQRESGSAQKVIGEQISGCLSGLTPAEMEKTVVAYEPVWAIGTGKTATSQQAEEIHRFIREWLQKIFGEKVGRAVRILYGGSVKPENADSLMSEEDIDGFLVGGASLSAGSFASIAESAGRRNHN
jgi:triosephosphate isomerase